MTRNNKKFFNVLIFSLSFLMIDKTINGQSIAINESNQAAHPSAILDVSSHSKGMLIPRLEMEARENIVNPPDGLWVYQTDGKTGYYFSQNGSWIKFSQKEYDNVPVGSVIDWLPQGQTLPDNYRICDGSTINDPESPFHNVSLPNLNGKFIKSVNINSIGSIGGDSMHAHTVPFGTRSTTFANTTHAHTASEVNVRTNLVSHTHDFSISVSSVEHDHEWARLNSNENWRSFNQNGAGLTMVNWTDGMGAEGSGNYPIAINSPGGLSQDRPFYTTTNTHTHNGTTQVNLISNEHSHRVIVPSVSESANAVHSHQVAVGNTNTTIGTHTPPYIQLVKIMRIK